MLSRLSIQNYAIIDLLEVDFSTQLNVITGETGAGKSIIVGALALILGQRADSHVLLNKSGKCIVEGYFKNEANQIEVTAFLKLHELDIHDELVVRREIASSGKSRAFINDTPVNLAQLNQLSMLLVDLHQQFDSLELGAINFQREVLDALSGNLKELKVYQQNFNQLQAARKNIDELKSQKLQFNKELDYHKFLYDELEEAALKDHELEELEQELKTQVNAEAIITSLTRTHYDLKEKEEPIISQLKSIMQGLQPFTELQRAIPSLLQRLQSVNLELQDIAEETENIIGDCSADAAAIERINERLSAGYRLLKKHGVKTTADLLLIQKDLHSKLQAVLHIDEAIIEAEKENEKMLSAAQAHAIQLSLARKAQVQPLEQQVNKMLSRIGMPNARLKVDIKEGNLSQWGSDEIEFLFDANKSNQFYPLRKVASGGELSRLMLCIKSLVASRMDLPTLIFDEIDSGISGEAARQVGTIMKELASARQVICITHQPQIAGRAHYHFLVYKALKNDTVTTGIRLLDTEERIVTIAQMLSGEKPTAAALENAREIVMN